MTDVHHCPHCELLFRNKTELEYHMGQDHAPPVEVATEPQPPPTQPET
ncbi:MAG TPA: hypothetical protein VHE80_07815 [Acidimicrobiales bacterium]|nr:hypothetical protein [Acidimicrobiales bacterium]